MGDLNAHAGSERNGFKILGPDGWGIDMYMGRDCCT